MEKIQIGPWRVPRHQQLLCLWIATVTEMATGTIPNPSSMGRYLKRLPPIKECLVHCDAISACALSHEITSLWGEKLNTPLVINTYRSFLSRILLPVNEGEIFDLFSKRAAAALDEKQILLLRSIVPYCPQLPPPPRDWSNKCAFGPGAVSEVSGQLSLYRKLHLISGAAHFDDSSGPTSRIILVPKNWKKKRLIAAEPILLGYLQHGLSAALMSAIESCSPIRFSDQEQNRCRCNMSHATIDLSDASDSVLLEHVRVLMPQWHADLVSVRSSYGRFRDKTIQLNMYGTMGSACTFPVETWVFYSLTWGIMNYLGATIEELSDIRVYGDDIVVPTSWGQLTAEFLESVGFKVNKSKSYWDTSVGYRETCGVETFYDTDVSPLRLPRGTTEMWLEKVDLQCLSDFISRLARYGCFETQRVLLSSLEMWSAYRPPWARNARLGSRTTDENLPAFTVFAPMMEESDTNVHLQTKTKSNLMFSSDQWDTFVRDFILSRQRNRGFNGSSRYLTNNFHDTFVFLEGQDGGGDMPLHSYRSQQMMIRML